MGGEGKGRMERGRGRVVKGVKGGRMRRGTGTGRRGERVGVGEGCVEREG